MIKTNELIKRYGRTYAVDSVSLEIEEGSFVGLVGPNGSGKTTLLKLIYGFCRPNHGEILVDGEPPGINLRSFVSFYPEIDTTYSWMRAGHLVQWYSNFFEDWSSEKEEELIDFFELPMGRLAGNLSRGMRARLKLILTLSRDAKIFLLDEPLSGIDPSSRERIIKAILKSYREDHTFILSTHIVSEVETLFERTIFLKHGAVAIDDNSDALREKYGKSIDEIFREEIYA